MKIKNNILITWVVLLSITLSCGAKKDQLVTIKTAYGDIKLVLFDDTPLHKQNFLKLASDERYDETIFHRVIKEFMIQGGDVNTKEGTPPSPAAMIPAEIHSHNFHVRGAVAAARSDNPERKSSECQFYIVQGRKWSSQELSLDQPMMQQYLRNLLNMPKYQELREEFVQLQQSGDGEALERKILELQPLCESEFGISLTKEVPQERLDAYTTIGGAPHLDDEYTVFGQVVSGMEVVDAIAEQPTDGMDKPIEGISMTVEVEELNRTKITKLYGYQYPDNK